nr:hypothetical protein [Tanacetum cinerariifolium]
MGRDTVQLETAVNTISHEYLLEFTSECGIPKTLHPELPGPEDRIVDFSEGKVGVYTRFFEFANFRFPLSQFLFDVLDMDLFNLIRAPNPTKVKTGSRPRTPHEVPLLTLTAAQVFEMDALAATTNSSGVPSTIKRFPLDFAHEAGASDQGTVTSEMPPSEDVPATEALVASQAKETAAIERPAALESRSSHGRKSLDAIQLGLTSTIHVPDDAPASVSDPYPLSFDDPLSRHPADVAQSSQCTAAAKDPESKNASFLVEIGQYNVNLAWQVAMGSQLRFRFEQKAKLLRKSVAQEEKLKAAFEEFKRQQDDRVEQRCAEMVARLDALIIEFDEELYPHMLTAIASRRWVIGRGLRLAVMKCGESLELRQVFADAVSTGITKGLSDGLRHGLEHGQAQLSLESIEAYDPQAKSKFVAAL